ncbi:hypothetical protein H6G89_23920 [Oscillatoria sp. FACHB-1407]|uniref:hypothetical protein n=1 Tax=Oscillatoria sp. FACHB-1407 TaxID=2692847 RepID=UPI0016886D36|nr:hypothetical protein [Oscillatoria sp. FACHB-1407]MBD2464055.1 hypothetical protein [Oscillatoria sp. FACHB-1407]
MVNGQWLMAKSAELVVSRALLNRGMVILTQTGERRSHSFQVNRLNQCEHPACDSFIPRISNAVSR